MLSLGLTGGIGSGKSTVAQRLVGHGAVLIDADRIAREIAEPGGPAYQPMLDRFGTGILGPDGAIDRKALAAVAFVDADELAALNAITHPLIGGLMGQKLEAQKGSDRVVVLDVPLLKPVHRDLLSLDLVVVVDCPVDLAVERLVSQRGFDRSDAEARVAAQMDRSERVAGADYVIDNSADRESLLEQVDSLWKRFVELEVAKSVPL